MRQRLPERILYNVLSLKTLVEAANMKRMLAVWLSVVFMTLSPQHTQAQRVLNSADAKEIYKVQCAGCHSDVTTKAPSFDAMSLLSAQAIRTSLTSGSMREQGSYLTETELNAVIGFLADRDSPTVRSDEAQQCEQLNERNSGVRWNRWGNGYENTRFQPTEISGFTAQNVAELSLAWAFGFPNAIRVRSQAAVTEDTLYVGSQDGTVYAIDLESGCVRWTFAADAEVRGALTLEESGATETLFFSDFSANVYALNAATGEPLWKNNVADHPATTITGSLIVFAGRVFVPLSSTEILNAANPEYECCTFRGGIAALDASVGRVLWRNNTVEAATKRNRNSIGTQLWGPSGAPVWSSPTVDIKRGLLYFGSGQNYSSPASDTSDAIIAVDLQTGETAWSFQTLKNDAWNAACVSNAINCPEEDGPDFDVGASPILIATEDHGDLVIAGTKSGMVYALDPDDNGRLLWQRRVGRGGKKGGIHWGMTTDGELVYVAIGDLPNEFSSVHEPRPGLHALDVITGEPVWSRYAYPTCSEDVYSCYPSFSAALTMTPGVIFAGGMDGTLHAFASNDGSELWSFNTSQTFETVNEVAAQGGSIDSDGAIIADGRLLMTSGYDLYGQIPGNVLLMFTLKGKTNVTRTHNRR